VDQLYELVVSLPWGRSRERTESEKKIKKVLTRGKLMILYERDVATGRVPRPSLS
jgi:hypothetical protein